VETGQWWRIWTGHLTHYDVDHLFWDLLMFVVLGAACERKHSRLFAPAIVLMIAGISTAIGLVCEGVTVYRGLSSLDTALFVWFLADQVRHALVVDRDRMSAALWLVPAAGLVGKLLYEATTGQTLFVEATTFTPLVEAHLAGVVAGLLCSLTIGWTAKAGRYAAISRSNGMLGQRPKIEKVKMQNAKCKM
jgi:rhomboid family GlyGly-CTERM serine protease